jgi:hypothetical protein
MGNKNKDAIAAGDIAAASMAENEGALEDAQTAYDTDLEALRNAPVSDFYAGLSANTIGTQNLKSQDVFDISKLSTAREFGKVGEYEENETSNFNAVGTKLSDVGYSAQGTNAGQLDRGAATGLSNVFNNLQVSTAGADMANQEADQALAASQDLAAQAGTGAGGATALAAAAAKSKQGISADIDRQVKSNEQLRAQGEQSLQRDMLSQGNLASQFDLGAQQFNVGAQNQAAQFGAGARNQANQFNASSDMQNQQFNAGQANQRNASMFSAKNQMSMFNAGQGNAERMAEYGAQNQANAANASAFNNALAQDAQSQNNYDMSKAAGQTQAESNQYGQANDLVNISTNELNNMNQSNDANSQIVAQGNAAQGTQNRNNKVLDVLDPLGIRKVFSDKRLKKNIEKIGTSKSGLNIYSFEYKNSDFGNGVYQGVMSDEIPSHAVVKEEDIYDMVDYSKIDVEFKLITN